MPSITEAWILDFERKNRDWGDSHVLSGVDTSKSDAIARSMGFMDKHAGHNRQQKPEDDDDLRRKDNRDSVGRDGVLFLIDREGDPEETYILRLVHLDVNPTDLPIIDMPNLEIFLIILIILIVDPCFNRADIAEIV